MFAMILKWFTGCAVILWHHLNVEDSGRCHGGRVPRTGGGAHSAAATIPFGVLQPTGVVRSRTKPITAPTLVAVQCPPLPFLNFLLIPVLG
jgi:hypothetical protein